MLNIVFVCNKFSPAHVYTIDSYSFVFKKAGYRIFLMKDFITDGLNLSSMGIPLFSVKEAKKEDLEKSIFYFVSPNVNNIKTLRLIKKKNKNAKCVYLYHEPITKRIAKEIINDRGFSFKTLKYVAGLYCFNGYSLIKHFDHVILPSKNANLIYEGSKSFKKISHSVLDLLFLSNFSFSNNKRIFFSYIGTIALNHGFNEFISFVLNNELPSKLNVLIATSSKLDEKIKNILLSKYGNRVTIYDGSFLDEKLIAELYRKTMVLWLGYKHSAQSGVLPMSFMHGTPIICSRIDSFKEYAKDGYNSEYIRIDCPESICKSIAKICNDFKKYHDNCLKTYSAYFNPENRVEEVLNLFKNI